MADLPVADLIVDHAGWLYTCAGPAPRRGPDQGAIEPIAGGAVASRDGRILFAGPSGDLRRAVTVDRRAQVVDASGCTVCPGFVDAHTHLVFAGDRRDELRRRLAGATYGEIAADGGGIVRTVAATREATEEDLAALAEARLDEMLLGGTTTCEAKSGYGLDVESELKILRVIRRLDASHPIDLSPTFLGAHEIPAEHRSHRERYVASVVDDMIPRVAADGLAEWCDVFCEEGVFTTAESERILRAGLRHGLRPRIHADELAPSGGWRVAVEVGARSADHLVFADDQAARGLAAAGVVATLAPTAPFHLKLGRFAPARTLIGAGVPVALATDLNPGGGLSPSMPFALALACFGMHMTLEEALVGATINAAFSIGRDGAVGSLEPGKLMDVVVLAGTPVELLRVGARSVRTVIKRGRIVVDDGTIREGR